MGDICSAIHDDMKKYEALCSKYHEPVQYDRTGFEPDCYGKHADKLRRKEEKERDAELGKQIKNEKNNSKNKLSKRSRVRR